MVNIRFNLQLVLLIFVRSIYFIVLIISLKTRNHIFSFSVSLQCAMLWLPQEGTIFEFRITKSFANTNMTNKI